VAVKVPAPGTRGSRFPRFPGWLARFFGRLQRSTFRRGHGARTQGGLQALLLETTGARSGKPRTAVLGYLEEPGGSWLVIASLAGAARNPGWLYNLAKTPEAVVELGDGRRIPVRAATLEGLDRDTAWKRIEVEAPEYPKYLSVTDRELAIVRLTPR
jgi:deazaflavin-dependent oxidoreductase (nitroreductase family)